MKNLVLDTNVILNVALSVKQESNLPTIVVSKDINVRIKANILGVDSEDYYHNKTVSDIQEDVNYILVRGEHIDRLYQENTKIILTGDIYQIDSPYMSPAEGSKRSASKGF